LRVNISGFCKSRSNSVIVWIYGSQRDFKNKYKFGRDVLLITKTRRQVKLKEKEETNKRKKNFWCNFTCEDFPRRVCRRIY
jgi:hypothetical protein